MKKRKIHPLRLFVLIIIFLIFGLGFFFLFNDSPKTKSEEEKTTQTEEAQKEVEPASEQTDPSQPYSVDGIIIVNKKHGVSADYAPGENSEAKDHLNALLQEMLNQGLSISTSYSGYRDYEYQRSLYENYVASHGQESADTFSARPGFSEHQTGLAFDLIQPDGNLLESAAETQWVAAHAHEYGFIVRYQSGKESITGYMAEPWHIRYIGDKATDIYESGLTLEEYLGVEGGTSY